MPRSLKEAFSSCFNSTLVRSRLMGHSQRADPDLVSIPHWFDQGDYPPAARLREAFSFNSTLVRSRQQERRADGLRLHSFNSTLVRSRLMLPVVAARAEGCFNSTLVRSRPVRLTIPAAEGDFVSIPHWFDQGSMRSPRARPHAPFQFHIGSIKARRGRSMARRSDSFQFHIGSIKAWDWRRRRLGEFSFQFHIGSIKAQTGVFRAVCKLSFQFHIGSIKAFIYPNRTVFICCFNSTLVRSRQQPGDRAGRTIQSFNSTLVRSRHCDNCQPPRRVHVSIPHWFDQGKCLSGNDVEINMFQFHIGSIKATVKQKLREAIDRVSIPHWFDQGSPSLRTSRLPTKFQFHIGSIKDSKICPLSPR